MKTKDIDTKSSEENLNNIATTTSTIIIFIVFAWFGSTGTRSFTWLSLHYLQMRIEPRRRAGAPANSLAFWGRTD